MFLYDFRHISLSFLISFRVNPLDYPLILGENKQVYKYTYLFYLTHLFVSHHREKRYVYTYKKYPEM